MTILTASRPWQCDCGRQIRPGELFGMDDGAFTCEECLTAPAGQAERVGAAGQVAETMAERR